MADGHLFNNISLGGRGGTNQGQIRIHSGGILWKKSGGGKAVEVDKDDIVGLSWMKVPRTNQLGVRSKDGLYYKFTGVRDQCTWLDFFLCGMHDYLCLNKDVATLTPFLQSTCGITPEEKQLSVSAKNWGEVELNGMGARCGYVSRGWTYQIINLKIRGLSKKREYADFSSWFKASI